VLNLKNSLKRIIKKGIKVNEQDKKILKKALPDEVLKKK